MRPGRRTQVFLAALGAALVVGAFAPVGASQIETEPAPTSDVLGILDAVPATDAVDDAVDGTVGPVLDPVDDLADETRDAVTEVVDGTVGTLSPLMETSPTPTTGSDSTSGAGMVDGTVPVPSTDAPAPATEPSPPIATDAGLDAEPAVGAADGTPTGVVEALGASVSSFRVPAGLLGLIGLGLVVQSVVLPPDRRLVSARTDRDLRRFR